MTVQLMAHENFPLRLVGALRQAGHDVAWVRESHPGLSDAQVLGLEQRAARIVATFDKDFGAPVFGSNPPAQSGIILIRINPKSRLLVPRVLAALQARLAWEEHLATIEPDRIRLRTLPQR